MNFHRKVFTDYVEVPLMWKMFLYWMRRLQRIVIVTASTLLHLDCTVYSSVHSVHMCFGFTMKHLQKAKRMYRKQLLPETTTASPSIRLSVFAYARQTFTNAIDCS